MTVLAPDFAPLEAWLAGVFGGAVRVVAAERLSGGAIQENWMLRLEGAGPPEAVLRRDAAAAVDESHSRANEYALLRAAAEAGVTVPQAYGLCEDGAVLGGPFVLMGKVAGVALGPRVVKDFALGGDRPALLARLGAELANLHAIAPPRADLGFLGAPPADPARAEVARVRAALDGLAASRPALEWGLRWAERHAPIAQGIVLTHRDFRTGNLLLDADGLTAVLDWEFAGWGDPMADLGWFCAECWRFSRPDLEAGGLGPRAAFYAGYAAASGRVVDDAAVRYWEVVAHLRWAVIALAQGWRHGSGAEPSLELALTGRLAATLELAVLRATGPQRWQAAVGVAAPPPRLSAIPAVPSRDLHPETTGSALLDAAQRAIEQALVPHLTGGARYAALMAASAVRMAAREMEQRARLDAAGLAVLESAGLHTGDDAALTAAVRRGDHDAAAGLHAALWADAAVRTSVAKPSALTRIERRFAGLPEADVA